MRIRHTDRTGAEHEADLFETFAALARDEIGSFPALRPHQRQAWHCFVVQVGALALLHAGETDVPMDAGTWRERLLALTPDHPDGEAWQLIVDDWSKPALLQPPGMPTRGSKGLKEAVTPDSIDMLVTGRNHDVKGSRASQGRDDDWLFALVTLQTFEGRMGAGNSGISRMNSGYGSRVFLGGGDPSEAPGASVVRDVLRLARHPEELAEHAPMRGSTMIVWALPWNGDTAISATSLHPLYVEICRRVRLVRGRDHGLAAVLTGSKVARIEAKDLKGMTGDPWAPVLTDGSKSWGLGAGGFGYRHMAALIAGGETRMPVLAKPQSLQGERPWRLSAAGITRGQGQTDGLHRRTVLIPPPAARRLARPDGRARLAKSVEIRLQAVAQAQKILRHALFALYQGGPNTVRLDDKAAGAKAQSAARDFDAIVDRAFFDEDFWAVVSANASDDTIEDPGRPWRMRLDAMASVVFARACRTAPRTQMRYHRAVARGGSILRGRMRRFVDPAEKPLADAHAAEPS